MKTVTKEAAEKMLKTKEIESSLFDKGYTILMPRNRARKWLKALRSGEYIQAEGILHNPNSGGFCCLGVEQFVNNGQVVENSFKSDSCTKGSWNYLPSVSYMKGAGMLYVSEYNNSSTNPHIKEVKQDVADLNDKTVTTTRKVNQHKSVTTTVHANDFAKIADLLDRAMLVY